MSTRSGGGLWVPLLAVLLGAAILLRVSITPTRFLDVDELEHLNAAYAIAHGESLYGSLFENHPPLLVWSLQPLVRSGLEAEALIRAARWWMLVPCLGILAITALLGRRLGGLDGALSAPLFLLSAAFFFEKGVEVRPDVPGALFVLLALLLLSRGERRWWVAAGCCLGIAGFFTPKAIFAALGMLMGRAVHDWSRSRRNRSGESPEAIPPARWPALRTLAPVAWAGISAAISGTMVVAALFFEGQLAGFWADCVEASARMTIDDPWAMRWALLGGAVLRGNPALWLLGTGGAAALLAGAWRSRHLPPGHPAGGEECALRFMVPLSLAGAIAGFFVMNAPLRQYFLFLLPQLAIAASWAAGTIVGAIRSRRWAPAAALAVLVGMLLPPWTVIWPVQRQGVEIEVLRTVLKTARPEERVLDLWSGLYVTRLPAYRYFFLNSDVIRLLPPERLASDLERVLDDPRLAVVIVDDHLRLLPSSAQRRIRAEFTLVTDYGFLEVLARRK